MYKKLLEKVKSSNKNQLLVGMAALAIVVAGVLVFNNSKASANSSLSFLKFGSRSNTVAQETVDYLNTSVLQQGQTATLVSSSEENGVIKFKINISGKEYDSYVTKNGKLLFPEGIAVDTKAANQPSQNPQNTDQPAVEQTPANIAKVDKSQLDIYVVSQCPYGIQMQRAVANAVTNIPSLAQNIKIRYIGAVSGNTITAMHGNEEAQENLKQICIREEQNSKYWAYVGCYIKNGDGAGCQKSSGIDENKLNNCIQNPKKGLAYAKEDFDLNAQYDIQGSPTLVLNGVITDETPFGGRSADSMRNMICSSSKNAPGFCSTKLDANQANTSFSLTYGDSNSGSTAANNSAGTNCAPAS